MPKNKRVNYIHFQCIDSTNTWAKNNSSILDPGQITCITASEQTAGRGRFERKWVSPKGVNLYATFYFCILETSSFLPNLAQVISLSTVRMLSQLGFSPQIKWPNDILLSKKKVAGVLCEAIPQKGSIGIALGIGINVNMEDQMLKEIDQPATSLWQVSRQYWSVDKILKELVDYFVKDLRTLESQGFSPFVPYYEGRLAHKGELIRVKDGDRVIEGICKGIAKNGHLILLLPDGEKKEIAAGFLL
jgi:BirA family biotin operon repressor/biotin-[acetyl-CoA-carboxylase] ligase